ncbi:unnamed protein product [Mucor hiemalis]
MTVTNNKITFYNAIVCPYAQRVAIALKEVGTEYEKVEIDLQNKPDWYAKEINPESKVPVLNVEGQNIAESLVLVEYIADRFPEANLLPKEAIKRANIRFAIEYFGSKINASVFKYVTNQKVEGSRATFESEVNSALVRFDQLLNQQSSTGPYFLGEQYSLADVALAPFVLRLKALLRAVLNNYEFEAVKNSNRLTSFIEGISSRPSVQETYVGDEKYVNILVTRFGVNVGN